MSMLLILNPGSRGGRSFRRHQLWCSTLDAEGVSFDTARTQGPGHARELAREAKGFETVVAVGGDGTINEVLDGLLLSGRAEVEMGVLYAGTSPDFCRFHRIPTEPVAALATLLQGEARRVDAVRIRYRGKDGEEIEGHFGCSCSVGMGAAVASTSNRLRPGVGDTLGTGLAVLRALFVQMPLSLTVSIDEEPVELERINHLAVLKNPYIASGLKLNANLGPADGRLCLVAAHGRTPLGMLALLPGFYSGEAIRAPGIFSRYCTSVSLAADGTCPLEFDGDPHGRLPAEVTLLPGALRLRGGRDD
jgi:diacylglycerol kinase family enzyme